MAVKALPSPEVLRQLLRYEPETGKLFWKERSALFFKCTKGRAASHAAALWNSRYAGTEALCHKNIEGYKVGAILGRTCQSHRVIWCLEHGEVPTQIDHINGNRSDNRISNLRNVSAAENSRNMMRTTKNNSGIVGVKWCKRSFIWIAEIKTFGKTTQLGRFELFWDAVAARKNAEANMGFHKNHGRAT